MQASKSKNQAQAKVTARPIAHLLHPVTEHQQATPVSHLPTKDTSVNKEVAETAVTGYN